MEMKQMVYVVLENGYLTGVWNEYKDAENHVGEDGVIIPAVVDTYGEREGCETPSEVVTAMEKELQGIYSASDDEEEEEEEDDDDEEVDYQDEDEDEEEEEGEEDEEGELTDDEFYKYLKMLFN